MRNSFLWSGVTLVIVALALKNSPFTWYTCVLESLFLWGLWCYGANRTNSLFQEFGLMSDVAFALFVLTLCFYGFSLYRVTEFSHASVSLVGLAILGSIALLWVTGKIGKEIAKDKNDTEERQAVKNVAERYSSTG